MSKCISPRHTPVRQTRDRLREQCLILTNTYPILSWSRWGRQSFKRQYTTKVNLTPKWGISRCDFNHLGWLQPTSLQHVNQHQKTPVNNIVGRFVADTDPVNGRGRSMSKRFIDTELWRKSWFEKLKPEIKSVWVYLITNCSHAGLLDHNMGLMSYSIGMPVTEALLREHFGERLTFFEDKIYVHGYIEYQQGCSIDGLNPSNNAHKNIINQLTKHNLVQKIGASGAPQEPLMRGPSNVMSSNSNVIKKGKTKKKKKATDVPPTPDWFKELHKAWPKRDEQNSAPGVAWLKFWRLLEEGHPKELLIKAARHYIADTGHHSEGKAYNMANFYGPKNSYWLGYREPVAVKKKKTLPKFDGPVTFEGSK